MLKVDQEIAQHGVGAVVMVQATKQAEAICQRSAITAVDLMRPYGFVEQTFSLSTIGNHTCCTLSTAFRAHMALATACPTGTVGCSAAALGEQR